MATTAHSSTQSSSSPDQARASTYLSSLLNTTLHIHIQDGRFFIGTLKCTDSERNIILSMTHEHRQPSPSEVRQAAVQHEKRGLSGNVKVDMKKRFVGLVVVPGRYISKIEAQG